MENESESFLVGGICSLDKGVYFGNPFEVKRMVKKESWEKWMRSKQQRSGMVLISCVSKEQKEREMWLIDA